MKTLKRKDIFNHLQRADSWMRELHGWLWHRCRTTKLRYDLIKDINAGEKILEQLQDLNVRIK